MTIKDIIQHWRERKQKFKDEDMHERHTYLRKQKKISPEERELQRYIEEERQERIKKMVKAKRLQKTREDMFGTKHNALYAENVMVGHRKLFTNDNNIFARKQKGGKKK